MINKSLAVITILSLTFSIVLCVGEIKQVSDWQNKAKKIYKHQLQDWKEWKSSHLPKEQDWWYKNPFIIGMQLWVGMISNMISVATFAVSAIVLIKRRRNNEL